MTIGNMGPLDGPLGRGERGSATDAAHQPTPSALADEARLHDAGLGGSRGVPRGVWVLLAVAAVAVVAFLLLG